MRFSEEVKFKVKPEEKTGVSQVKGKEYYKLERANARCLGGKLQKQSQCNWREREKKV